MSYMYVIGPSAKIADMTMKMTMTLGYEDEERQFYSVLQLQHTGPRQGTYSAEYLETSFTIWCAHIMVREAQTPDPLA